MAGKIQIKIDEQSVINGKKVQFNLLEEIKTAKYIQKNIDGVITTMWTGREGFKYSVVISADTSSPYTTSKLIYTDKTGAIVSSVTLTTTIRLNNPSSKFDPYHRMLITRAYSTTTKLMSFDQMGNVVFDLTTASSVMYSLLCVKDNYSIFTVSSSSGGKISLVSHLTGLISSQASIPSSYQLDSVLYDKKNNRLIIVYYYLYYTGTDDEYENRYLYYTVLDGTTLATIIPITTIAGGKSKTPYACMYKDGNNYVLAEALSLKMYTILPNNTVIESPLLTTITSKSGWKILRMPSGRLILTWKEGTTLANLKICWALLEEDFTINESSIRYTTPTLKVAISASVVWTPKILDTDLMMIYTNNYYIIIDTITLAIVGTFYDFSAIKGPYMATGDWDNFNGDESANPETF